jgi:hypothetical protein
MLNHKRNTIAFEDDKIFVIKKGSYYETQTKTGFVLSFFNSKEISTIVDIHIKSNLDKWRNKC